MRFREQIPPHFPGGYVLLVVDTVISIVMAIKVVIWIQATNSFRAYFLGGLFLMWMFIGWIIFYVRAFQRKRGCTEDDVSG